MSAIVTGGAGFIGSHLVDRLAADGQRVHVIDESHLWTGRGGKPGYVHRWPKNVTVKWHGIGGNVPAVDTIYHLAGPVGPVGVLKRSGWITRDIIGTTDTIRHWALRMGARLVYVSTSEVYGLQQQPMTEHAPRIIAAGHSARMEYAIAKMAAETMLLNTPDLDVRIIRPFNVAGPRQREEGGFVLPRFIRQAKNGEPLTVYTPGTQRRAFTHVLDIVDGIVRAASAPVAGEVYNLGNPANECSIWDLAEEVRAVLGSSSDIEVIDPVTLWGPAFHEAPDKVPDITKARLIGWEPRYDRRTVIEDAAAA